MQLRQKIQTATQFIKPHLSKWVILVGVLLLSFGTYIMVFFPRTVTFSYSGDNCVSQMTLLPRLLRTDENDAYALEITNTIDIAGYPVVGRSVCVSPLVAPQETTTKMGLSPFGGFVARKTFTINTPAPPVVSVVPLDRPLPATKPVTLPLSSTDEVFAYNLVVDGDRVLCVPEQQAVWCDLPQLNLAQGEVHELAIERQFKNSDTTVIAQRKVDIVPAVTVENASVRADQMIYSKPTEFVIRTNKPLAAARAVLQRVEDDTKHDELVDVAVAEDSITITMESELARDSAYILQLTDAEGIDASTLDEPYTIPFWLSGGPKVTGVSIGSSGVDANATVILQFDQRLKDDQDISQLITFSGGGATVTKKDDRAYVQLSNLGRCVDFTISVAGGVLSEYNIMSDHTWSFSSRTRCYVISTIGYSVQGRPINAYYFGNGSQTVLFTGAIHGSELSSKYIMDSWIAELETNAHSIPADKQIVVIPAVNPDGVAVTQRYNANSVNLNRNFPTTNWVSDTEVSGGRVEEGAGGPSPLSEPESAILAAFTQRLRPRLVVTYHSLGSLVNSNDVGIAATLGPRYASLARYWHIPNNATTSTFGFEMTGTYESWLRERSTPAILIELNTHTGNHFPQNNAAMWAMVRG